MRARLGRAAAALARVLVGLGRTLRPGGRRWRRASRLGEEMLGLQRWHEAAEACRAAVELRPACAASHGALATALAGLERWEEAAAACRRAAELDPRSPERFVHLGNVLLKSGRWDEAAAAYQQALAPSSGGLSGQPGAPAHRGAAGPLDAEALLNLGGALWKSGRLAEAAAAYGRATEIAPGHTPARKNLGAVLAQLGRWEESAAAFRRAVEAAPQDGEAFFSLGGALWKSERWEEAAGAYRRAASLDPGHASAHRNLAAVLGQLRRWEESALAFRGVAELEPGSVEAWVGLGCALLNAERPEEAVAALDRGLALDPGDASVHLNRGVALANLERWDEAASACRRAVELRPGEARPAFELGGVLWRAGRREEAVAAYRRATQLAPGDVAAHRNLAAVLGQLERWEEVASVYRRAAQVDPKAADIHTLLGSALLRTGCLEEAAAAFRRSIVAAPDSAEPYALLGFTLSRLGRTREAEAAYRRAVGLAPDLAERIVLPVPGLAWKRVDEGVATLKEEMAAGPTLDPVADRVLGLERWVERLASARDGDGGASSRGPGSPPGFDQARAGAGEARLLFVLDNDYGELTTLMYLLLGQELLGRSTLLLPDRLYASNRDVMPGRTHRYDSVADILASVDAGRPQVVFLLSGYLFAIHRIFSLQALDGLVRGLRERGCRIVTSDPFLGTLSRHDVHAIVSVHLPERYQRAQSGGDVEPDAETRRVLTGEVDRSLRLLLSGSEQILRDFPHLYPAHPEVPGHLAGPRDGRNLSFFNPRLLVPGTAAGFDGSAAAEPGGGASAAPHWLFVLSATDYETQYVEETQAVFVDLVMGKLRQTVQAGRRAVFVGPKDLIQSLEARMPAEEGVTLLSFCSFKRFTSLLLGAEYAFYWNVVSHSILMRLFNQLPVFLFDRGHLVRNVKPMYERVIAWYYQGWEPAYLDHREPLVPETLARLAARFREAAGGICQGFRRAPAPVEMVERILGQEDRVPAREGRGEA